MRTLSFLAAVLFATTASAQSLDDVVSNVMKEYGGSAAWEKVTALQETGTVIPMMRKGDGKVTRSWQKPDKLRIEIVYPTDREVRVLDGDHGTRNDKVVTGPSLDAMKLQAGRLALPYLLVSQRASLHDRGVVEGLRVLEIPLSSGLTLTLRIDPKNWHILRSSGTTTGLEFVVDYSDFRRVGGLLFPFAEAGVAQGMPTATTKLDAIVINPVAAAPAAH